MLSTYTFINNAGTGNGTANSTSSSCGNTDILTVVVADVYMILRGNNYCMLSVMPLYENPVIPGVVEKNIFIMLTKQFSVGDTY